MISRDQHFQDLHHPFYGYITFIKSKRIIGFPVKSFLHQSRFDMIKKSNKTLKNFVAILLPGWYLVASKAIYISVFISKYSNLSVYFSIFTNSYILIWITQFVLFNTLHDNVAAPMQEMQFDCEVVFRL